MNSLESIINKLYFYNIKHRPSLEETGQSLNQYSRNYCTIRLFVGRGIGHSYYIKNNVTQYDAIVIHQEMEFYYREFSNVYMDRNLGLTEIKAMPIKIY